MDIVQTLDEKLSQEFSIHIASDVLQKDYDQRLLKLGGKVKMPGFRPGKVPKKMLAQRYHGAVMQEMLEQKLQEGVQKIVEQHELQLAQRPNVEVKKFTLQEGLECKISCETLPKIPGVTWSDITLEKLVLDPSAEVVEETLERITKEKKDFVALDKPRKSQEGDQILIDFVGECEGKAYPQLAATGVAVELGAGRMLADFEKALLGREKDEKFTFSMQFPADYGGKEVAGKEVSFAVTVHDLKESKPFELSDDSVGQFGVKSVSEFREKISESLQGTYAPMLRELNKKTLFDDLDNRVDFALPAGLVENEYRTIIMRSFEEDNQGKSQEGKEAPKFEALQEKLSAEEKKEYRDIAARRVKLGLLLQDVARQEKIAVTQEDLQKAIFEQARNYPGQEQKVIEAYRNNRQALESLHPPILEEKVVDFIFGKIGVDEKALSIEELMERLQEQEEEEAPPKTEQEGTKKTSAAQEKTTKAESESGSESKTGAAKKADDKPEKKTAAKPKNKATSTKTTTAKKTATSTASKSAVGQSATKSSSAKTAKKTTGKGRSKSDGESAAPMQKNPTKNKKAK